MHLVIIKYYVILKKINLYIFKKATEFQNAIISSSQYKKYLPAVLMCIIPSLKQFIFKSISTSYFEQSFIDTVLSFHLCQRVKS